VRRTDAIIFRVDGYSPTFSQRRTAAPFAPRFNAGLLWMNWHAKRLECVQLAGAVVRRGWFESGSKLHALQTLRAVRLRLCRAVVKLSL
jgi:hypothetical protein